MTNPVPILTDELIDRVLRRAERDVCPPGDARCCGFSSGAVHALSTLTPDGWCTVGWVSAGAARQTWDVRFHVDTGAVRCAEAAVRR